MEIDFSKDFYVKLPIQFDITRLQADAERLISTVGWRNNQISLQHPADIIDSDERWSCANAGIATGSHGTRDYSIWNEALQGTYLWEVLNSLPEPVCRTRLIRLSPKKVFPVHSDPVKAKFHITIFSVPEAVCFVFPEQGRSYSLVPDGHLCAAKVDELHTVFNGSTIDRVHIVGHLADPRWWTDTKKYSGREGWATMPP